MDLQELLQLHLYVLQQCKSYISHNKSRSLNQFVGYNTIQYRFIVQVIIFLQNIQTILFLLHLFSAFLTNISKALCNAAFSSTLMLHFQDWCVAYLRLKNPSLRQNHMPFNWSGLESRSLCLLGGCTSKASYEGINISKGMPVYLKCQNSTYEDCWKALQATQS